MAKTIKARYSVYSGLAGCYMPDYHSGPHFFNRRKDLAAHIRYELEWRDWPANLIREVNLTRLWSFIKSNGSSSAHFKIYYKSEVLAFNGLTEAEYQEMAESNDE
jgi:hypothetical protein